MRILAINWQDWEAPHRGGAEFYLKEILTRLVSHGHEVTLLCCSYPGAPHKEVLDGVKIIRTGSRNTFNFHLYGRPIRNFLRSNDFDVVLDDLNKIPFYTPLWAGKTPVVGIVMHVFRSEIFKEVGLIPGSYVYWTEGLIPRVYRKGLFGCLGESGKKELVEMGMCPERIFPLLVGVNPVFSPGPKKREWMIASVTRLMRYKCIDHVIFAMVMLRQRGLDVRCEIAGTGPDSDRLDDLINRLGLRDHVKLLGWVPLKDVVKLYQRAAVAVQPSAKEGWGFLATDAGACGTPVVAARVPGLTDSVKDKKTGFLYQHGDIDEMADYIQRLLTNEKLRRKMGEANRRWAKSLTWDKVARKLERLLVQAAEQRI
ncbi:MAG: glycosyltransferase family 4 protein [candidate division WOR-3 bacterium]|nr:glycosyltransferase family 4 protein [candidate division WOR-3 bacterium]